MHIVTVAVVLSVVITSATTELAFKYHSNDELQVYMKNFADRFPIISKLYTIGTSHKGQELYVLRLTTTKDFLAPNVKLIGNIHGNEAITREVLLQFIEYVGTAYTNDPTISKLLNSTILHILPTLNPDGFSHNQIGLCESTAGRNNANNVDLNRNYPDYHANLPQMKEEPETTAIRKWLNMSTFALSAALHSGALVANYPFDSSKGMEYNTATQESIAPDDDVLKHLALAYSRVHPTMMDKGCDGRAKFPNGITNGAKWYSFRGGMGDYNYAFKGVMELTLEIYCCKFPMPRLIAEIFNENKKALVAFVSEAQYGVRGYIIDYNIAANVMEISLKIKGRDIYFYPDSVGRFWRILLPGTYTLEVMSNKTLHLTLPFTVKQNSATILNVEMYPSTSTSPAEVTQYVPIVPISNSTTTTMPSIKTNLPAISSASVVTILDMTTILLGILLIILYIH